MDLGAKLRYGAGVGLRNTLALLLLVACQAPAVGDTGFGSMPDVTTAPVGASTGGSSSSSSSGLGTGEASGSASGSGDTTAGPARDLGSMPDFGDGSPVGCKGKIDFLFVISRSANMVPKTEVRLHFWVNTPAPIWGVTGLILDNLLRVITRP